MFIRYAKAGKSKHQSSVIRKKDYFCSSIEILKKITFIKLIIR